MTTLDWLIVGGGIHGVHIAARLVGEAGIPREQIRIVDPAKHLLANWRSFTRSTGMAYLRSPGVHHLDLKPFSLQRFAGKRKVRQRGLFAHPYERPSLELFNSHCDHVLDTFGLEELHIRGRANRCSVDRGGVGIQLSDERELTANNVVLALGASDQPARPDWATPQNDRLRHVFEPARGIQPSAGETVAVVGGGISACQVALRLLDEGLDVHLVSRHPVREHQFDSDPGWLGPKLMANFSRVRDLDHRRAMIAAARHRGSVPPDVRRALRIAANSGYLHWHQGEVERLDQRNRELRLELSNTDVVEANHILLATGFATHRPGGALVDELIASLSLPLARCGYPVVDTALRWHHRLHVSGPLAELELGPAARNIAGARRAGDRLVDAISSQRSTAIRRAS